MDQDNRTTGGVASKVGPPGFWVVVVGLVISGCLGPSDQELQTRRAELEAQGRALTASADTLEERLMGNQAALALWSEMARRHQSVSALACRNQDAHFEGMVRYLQYQEDKGRKLRHRALAEAEPVLSDSVGSEHAMTRVASRVATRVAQASKLGQPK